jgi:hypothetical protein
MRIPVETLLAGVSRTLLQHVLPQVADRAARGQLYAAVDVLRNLERRVEWAHAPREAEAASIEAALRAASERLRASGADALAARLAAQVDAWPAGPAAERALAARAALADAFAALADAPAAAADAVRPLLGGHLAAQAVRELALLSQQSLLEEISRG